MMTGIGLADDQKKLFYYFLFVAKSRIPALRDSQSVLNRKVPTKSLEAAVKKVKKLKGIVNSTAVTEHDESPTMDAEHIKNGKHERTALKRSSTVAGMNGDTVNGSSESSNSSSSPPPEKIYAIELIAPSTNGSHTAN